MRKTKILIVDDEKKLVDMIKEQLEGWHFEVIYAYNGLQGLKKAREENPDVLLLDLVLPDMDGYEVCSRLKADPVTKNIPVVIMTGGGVEDIARNEPEILAEAYLGKPFKFEELHNLIKNLSGGEG